jgi:hypothetical protein
MKNKTQLFVIAVAVSLVLVLLAMLGFHATVATKPVLADDRRPHQVANFDCYEPNVYPPIPPIVHASDPALFIPSAVCAETITELSQAGYTLDFVASDVGGISYFMQTGEKRRMRDSGDDVELLECVAPSLPSGVGNSFFASSVSAGLTPPAPGPDCAGVIASLEDSGFKLRFVVPPNNNPKPNTFGLSLVYVMIRSAD